MAVFGSIKNQINNSSGTTDTEKIKIDSLPIGEIFSKKNIRESDNIEIEDLKASIEKVGLLQPITVYKKEDDYICIMGHRRLQAFKDLYKTNPDKYSKINAVITDDENITIRQIIENVQRENLKPIEFYNALKEMKSKKLKIKDMAAIIGKSEGYLKNIFSSIKEIDSDPEIKELFEKSPDMTFSDIQVIQTIDDKEAKLKLLEQKSKGEITGQELKGKVKNIKGESGKKKDPQKNTAAADTKTPKDKKVNTREIIDGITKHIIQELSILDDDKADKVFSMLLSELRKISLKRYEDMK